MCHYDNETFNKKMFFPRRIFYQVGNTLNTKCQLYCEEMEHLMIQSRVRNIKSKGLLIRYISKNDLVIMKIFEKWLSWGQTKYATYSVINANSLFIIVWYIFHVSDIRHHRQS